MRDLCRPLRGLEGEKRAISLIHRLTPRGYNISAWSGPSCADRYREGGGGSAIRAAAVMERSAFGIFSVLRFPLFRAFRGYKSVLISEIRGSFFRVRGYFSK